MHRNGLPSGGPFGWPCCKASGVLRHAPKCLFACRKDQPQKVAVEYKLTLRLDVNDLRHHVTLAISFHLLLEVSRDPYREA